MRYDDWQIEEMLAYYVRYKAKPSTIARKWGMTLAAARCILKGVTYGHVQRPEGFEYPFPRRPQKKLDPRAIQEGLQLFWENGWTAHRLAEHLGCLPGSAWQIVVGKTYLDVPRPWPDGAMNPAERRRRWMASACRPTHVRCSR
jgi:hypothetical protein